MQRDSDRTGPGENDRWAGKRRVGRERDIADQLEP